MLNIDYQARGSVYGQAQGTDVDSELQQADCLGRLPLPFPERTKVIQTRCLAINFTTLSFFSFPRCLCSSSFCRVLYPVL